MMTTARTRPQRKPIRVTVGESIRSLRVSRGLTQTELALRSGVSPSVISRVEAGLADTVSGRYESIARALGVSVARLFKR